MAQIIFKDNRKTKTIALPSFEDSEVEVYTDLSVGEYRKILSKYPDNDKNPEEAQKMGIEIAVNYIKKWNFFESKDKPLEITFENLEKFCMKDLLAITKVANPEQETEKKS